MPYCLLKDESVAEGVKRLVQEQIDRAVDEIEDPDLDRDKAVHQVRKRCKKMRAALRIVRDDLDKDDTFDIENRWYRDAARDLSFVRDAEVLIATYDKLMKRFEDEVECKAFAPIRRKLTLRRKRAAAQHEELDHHLETFKSKMLEGRERVPAWRIKTEGFAAVEPGLKKTYSRARKALAAAYAESAPEQFHDWRKRVKYHWYHCRLLVDIWKPVMAARRDQAKQLGSLLGDEHDLTVFRETLLDEEGAFGDQESLKPLLALVDLRQNELRNAAKPLGEQLFAEKPKAFAARMAAYWRAWRGV